jgi:hypothetical protein
MTEAYFEAKPLGEQDPGKLCKRLVDVLAPMVVEIAHRSGASTELVLRRDAGTWRRDEVYITKAELVERMRTLPPSLRAVFDPLELGAPAGYRAAEVSESELIDDADIVE